MPTELRELKQRIGSTVQIRRVTSTLQRVAAARLARDRRAIQNSRRYLEELARVLQAAHAAAPAARHPLMAARPAGACCLVIFGADRGLCGGFTTGLMEELERFMGGAGRGPLQLVVMGKIAERRTRRAGHGIARAYRQAPVSYIAPGAGAEAGSPAGLAEVGRVAGFVTDGFLEGRYREVHLLYAEFISALRQPALVKPLLPLALPPHPSPRLRAALLEPDAERILARVAPEFVERSLYDAFINSLGSENAARQLAMSRATENAGELLEELVIGYRRMRQDGITAEMLELFGGEGAATE